MGQPASTEKIEEATKRIIVKEASAPPANVNCATVESVDQLGGTCYAHAAARIMLHCWRRIPGVTLPSMKDFVAEIVRKYGSEGGHSPDVITYFGNPSGVDKSFNKPGKYFELPALSHKKVPLQEAFRSSLEVVKIGDIVCPGFSEALMIFSLQKHQWDRLENFFQRNPNGTLTAADLNVAVPNEAPATDPPTLLGHAVIIDLNRSCFDRIVAKDSGGFSTSRVLHFASHDFFSEAEFYVLRLEGMSSDHALMQQINKLFRHPDVSIKCLDHSRLILEKNEIGSGSEGKVYPGTYNHRAIAGKVCDALSVDRNFNFEHPHIVKRLGWTFYESPNLISFDAPAPTTNDQVCVVMEPAQGDLTKFTTLPLIEKQRVILHVARAIAHLCSVGVVHLDLNPKNVVNFGETWKVTDFGAAKNISDVDWTIRKGTKKFTDPSYMAGDIIPEEHRLKLDVYSIGALIEELNITTETTMKIKGPFVTYSQIGKDCMKPLAERATIGDVLEKLERNQCLFDVHSYAIQQKLTSEQLLLSLEHGAEAARINDELSKSADLFYHLNTNLSAFIHTSVPVVQSAAPPSSVRALYYELTPVAWTQHSIQFHLDVEKSPLLGVAVRWARFAVQADVDKLYRFERLCILDLSNCARVTSIDFVTCTKLLELNLSNTGISQQGISNVNAPNLQTLVLSGCRQVTDVTRMLQNNKVLSKLILDKTGVTGITFDSTALQELSLLDCPDFRSEESLLGKFPSLKILNLRRTANVSQQFLDTLQSAELEEVYLTDCNQIKNISQLVTGQKLRILHLEGTNMCYSGLKQISAPLMEELDLTGCRSIMDIRFLLKENRTLKILTLDNTRIVQMGIEGITAPELTTLNLVGCADIYRVDLLLGDCNSLTSLDLRGTSVDQSGMPLGAPLLQLLYLDGCNGVTKVSGLLRNCKSLVKLSLENTGVDQDGIAGVEAPLLEKLWLTNCVGINSVRILLRGCDSLRVLYLDGTSVNDDGLLGINAPSLEYLCLDECKGVTDVSELLRDCKSLQELSLEDTGVTQDGIAGVEAPLLEKLWLTNCEGIKDLRGLLRDSCNLDYAKLTGSGVTQSGVEGVHSPTNAIDWK